MTMVKLIKAIHIKTLEDLINGFITNDKVVKDTYRIYVSETSAGHFLAIIQYDSVEQI